MFLKSGNWADDETGTKKKAAVRHRIGDTNTNSSDRNNDTTATATAATATAATATAAAAAAAASIPEGSLCLQEQNRCANTQDSATAVAAEFRLLNPRTSHRRPSTERQRPETDRNGTVDRPTSESGRCLRKRAGQR